MRSPDRIWWAAIWASPTPWDSNCGSSLKGLRTTMVVEHTYFLGMMTAMAVPAARITIAGMAIHHERLRRMRRNS